jgi:hypothetical protein
LVLVGGNPVEILVEQKPKRREIPKLEPNENCYYAALRGLDGEEGSGSEESDECESDECEPEGEDGDHGEPTAKEESESDFNQEFKSSTLAPGPSQEELKQAEKKSKAALSKLQ